MPDTAFSPATIDADLMARQALYRFFSLAFSDPRSAGFARLSDPRFLELCCAAAETLRGDPSAWPNPIARAEAGPEALALETATARLGDSAGDLVAAYDRLFGFVASNDCPPYETEYCPQTFAVYRSQEMADIAGFYRAFGLESGTEPPERPDHVCLELEFMSFLLAKEMRLGGSGDPEAVERFEILREAEKKFVRDHLCWWLPAFCAALRNKVGDFRGESPDPGAAFYAAAAKALASFAAFERENYGLPLPTEPPGPNPSPEDTAPMECQDLAPSPPVNPEPVEG